MGMTRRKVLAAGAAALGVPWIGMSLAQPKREIRIGQTMPYSGPASAYGSVGRFHRALFHKVNDEGGIRGTPIRFMSLDDGYKPASTVEQVRKLVELEEVDCLFSPLGTAPNSAIHKYVNDRKVPHLFVGSAAAKWNDPRNYPWTFGFALDYRTEGEIYAKYILATRPRARIAILHQNDDFGRDLLAGVEKGLGPERAKMIVARATYEVADPTIDSQILTLKASGADTYIAICTARAMAQSIRKVYDSGWRPPLHILSYAAASVGAVLAPAGLDKSRDVITLQSYKDPSAATWADDPAVLAWRGFMGKHYREGDVLDAFNVLAAINGDLMVHVLRQCEGNFSRENIRLQAENVRNWKHGLLLPGITVNTSATDHAAIEQARLARFDGRQWVLFGDVLRGSAG